MKKDILSMLPTELESELAGLGEPKYRAEPDIQVALGGRTGL